MRRILWFRRDLRIDDNLLLSLEGEVLPLFIFDTHILKNLPKNDRRITFIFDQVIILKKQLKQTGLDLAIFYGEPETIFNTLMNIGFDEVCASGDYDAYSLERDRKISHLLPFHTLHDTYIFRPDEVVKKDGSCYLVFTPFYSQAKKAFTSAHLAKCQRAGQSLIPFAYDILHTAHEGSQSITLESIGFQRQEHHILRPETLLDAFESKLADYKERRDFPDEQASSGLSAHLRFGTLGIRELLRWIYRQKHRGIDTEPFFRQLIFRDFYAMLLYHFPHLATENFRYPFKGIPDANRFTAFCNAQTGVPIVDAGVKELLQTGKMHNRVRMICASFFTKDLLLPWQWGEAFFAKHLIDYDAASNILSWQWSAGTGVDPQPYFRIFNPYLQNKKFDRNGRYIKQWLPILRSIDSKYLYDESYLSRHLVKDYPTPIVEHKVAAAECLIYFKKCSDTL